MGACPVESPPNHPLPSIKLIIGPFNRFCGWYESAPPLSLEGQLLASEFCYYRDIRLCLIKLFTLI
jgi:hypothetical protein